MKLLQETTHDWKVPTPNHIYIFGASSMRIIGYIKQGTTEAIRFSTPQSFNKKMRTFRELSTKEHDQYNLTAVQNA